MVYNIHDDFSPGGAPLPDQEITWNEAGVAATRTADSGHKWTFLLPAPPGSVSEFPPLGDPGIVGGGLTSRAEKAEYMGFFINNLPTAWYVDAKYDGSKVGPPWKIGVHILGQRASNQPAIGMWAIHATLRYDGYDITAAWKGNTPPDASLEPFGGNAAVSQRTFAQVGGVNLTLDVVHRWLFTRSGNAVTITPPPASSAPAFTLTDTRLTSAFNDGDPGGYIIFEVERDPRSPPEPQNRHIRLGIEEPGTPPPDIPPLPTADSSAFMLFFDGAASRTVAPPGGGGSTEPVPGLVGDGDSLIYGQGAGGVTSGDFSKTVMEVLGTALGMPRYRRGLPGSTVPEMQARTLADTVRSPWGLIIWCGHNDARQGGLAGIVPGIAATAAIAPRYLVLSLSNATDAGAGTQYYTDVIGPGGINDQLEAAHGPANYLDIRQHMVTSGLAQAGITPTAGDLTDIGNDAVPRSLLAANGSGHMNEQGQAVVAERVRQHIVAQGWIPDGTIPDPPPTGITHGSQLTTSNTGVPAGTVLTSQAVANTSGLTFESRNFTGGPIVITGSNNIYNRCKFNQHVTVRNPGANNEFNWCTFARGYSLSSCSFPTLYRCQATGGGDISHMTADSPNGTAVTDCRIEECLHWANGAASLNLSGGFTPGNGPHVDGLQIRGANRLTIIRSAYDLGPWFTLPNSNGNQEDVLNAAYFPEGGAAPNTDMTVTDTHFDGGGYVIYHRAFNGFYTFSRNSVGDRGNYGRMLNDNGATRPTQSGNYILSTGTPIAIPASGGI